MRKMYFLLAIAAFGIFALAGCGMTANTTTTTASNQNTAAKTNTATTPSDTAPTTILKPGDVSPDKSVKVIELINSVAASNDGWKGKEVTVAGYVSATSGSGKQQLLTIINDSTGTNKLDVSCAYMGDASAVFSKTVEVTGKINHIETGGDYKSVNLEPCDLKK